MHDHGVQCHCTVMEQTATTFDDVGKRIEM
jgi:hypothetical protein